MKIFRFKAARDEPAAERAPEPEAQADGDPGGQDRQPPPGTEPAQAALEATAADPPAPPEAPAPNGDNFLAQISAQADKEMAEQEQLIAGSSAANSDPLDPGLLDIFRDAKNAVQESSLATELEDVPAQELLDELMSVSQGLGITSGAPRRSREEETVEPGADSGAVEPAVNGEAGEPSADAEAVQPSVAEAPGPEQPEDLPRQPLIH